MLIETYFKHISNILEFYQIPSEEYLTQWKSTSNILGIYNYLKNIVNNTNNDSMNVGLKIAYASYKCILDLHVTNNLSFIVFDESRVIDLFKFILKWLAKLVHSKAKGEFDYFFSEWFNIIKETCENVKSMQPLVVSELTPAVLDLLTTVHLPMTNVKNNLSHWNGCLNFPSVHNLRQETFYKFEHKFYKLGEVICSCGDYNAQVAILDTVFHYVGILNNEAINRLAIKWFPSMEEIRIFFVNVPFQNFDLSCRSFLNLLNTTLRNNIVSLECESVYMGNTKLTLPKQSSHQFFWFDCNIGTLSISLSYFNILEKNERELIIITEEMVLQVILWHEVNLTTIDFLFKPSCKDLPPFNKFDNWNCKLAVTSSNTCVAQKIIEEDVLHKIFGNSFQYLKVKPQQAVVLLDSNAAQWHSFKPFKGSISKWDGKNLVSPVHASSCSSADSSDPTKNLKKKLQAYKLYEYKVDKVARYIRSPPLSCIAEETDSQKQEHKTEETHIITDPVFEMGELNHIISNYGNDIDEASDDSVPGFDLLDIATNIGNISLVNSDSDGDECLLQDEYVTSSSNSIIGDTQVLESDSSGTQRVKMNKQCNKEILPSPMVEKQNNVQYNKISDSNEVIYSSDDNNENIITAVHLDNKIDDSSSEDTTNRKISKSFANYRIRKRPAKLKFSKAAHMIRNSRKVSLSKQLNFHNGDNDVIQKHALEKIHFQDLVKQLQKKLSQSPIMSSSEGSDILSEETVLSSDQQHLNYVSQRNNKETNTNVINKQLKVLNGENASNTACVEANSPNLPKVNNKNLVEDNKKPKNRRSTTSTVTDASTINVSESSEENIVKEPLKFVKVSRNKNSVLIKNSATSAITTNSKQKISKTPENINTSTFRRFMQKSSILQREVYVSETPESDTDMELTQIVANITKQLERQDSSEDENQTEVIVKDANIANCDENTITSPASHIANNVSKLNIDNNKPTAIYDKHIDINTEIIENIIEDQNMSTSHRTVDHTQEALLSKEIEHINKEKIEEKMSHANESSKEDLSVSFNISTDMENSKTDHDNSTKDSSLNKSVDSTASTVLLVKKKIIVQQNKEIIQDSKELCVSKYFKNNTVNNITSFNNDAIINNQKQAEIEKQLLVSNNETSEPSSVIVDLKLQDKTDVTEVSEKKLTLSDTLDESSEDIVIQNCSHKCMKSPIKALPCFPIDKNNENQEGNVNKDLVINLMSEESDSEEMGLKRIFIKKVRPHTIRKENLFPTPSPNVKFTEKNSEKSNIFENMKTVDIYDVSQIHSDYDNLSGNSKENDMSFANVFKSKDPTINQDLSLQDKSLNTSTKEITHKFFKSKSRKNDTAKEENNFSLQEKATNNLRGTKDLYDIVKADTNKNMNDKLKRKENPTCKLNKTKKGNLFGNKKNKTEKVNKKLEKVKKNVLNGISIKHKKDTTTGEENANVSELATSKSTVVDKIISSEITSNKKSGDNLSTTKTNDASGIKKASKELVEKLSTLIKPIENDVSTENVSFHKKITENINAVVEKVVENKLNTPLLNNISNTTSVSSRIRPQRKLYTPGMDDSFEKDESTNPQRSNFSDFTNLSFKTTHPGLVQYIPSPVIKRKRKGRAKKNSFSEDSTSVKSSNKDYIVPKYNGTNDNVSFSYKNSKIANDSLKATNKSVYSDADSESDFQQTRQRNQKQKITRQSKRITRKIEKPETQVKPKSDNNKTQVRTKRKTKRINYCELDSELSENKYTTKETKTFVKNLNNNNEVEEPDLLREEIKQTDILMENSNIRVLEDEVEVNVHTELIDNEVPEVIEELNLDMKNDNKNKESIYNSDVESASEQEYVSPKKNVDKMQIAEKKREKLRHKPACEKAVKDVDQKLKVDIIDNNIAEEHECNSEVEPASDQEYIPPKKNIDKKKEAEKKKQKIRYKPIVKKAVEKVDHQGELQIELVSNDVESSSSRSSLSDVKQYVREVIGDITFSTTDISINKSEEGNIYKGSKHNESLEQVNKLRSDINVTELDKQNTTRETKVDYVLQERKKCSNQDKETSLKTNEEEPGESQKAASKSSESLTQKDAEHIELTNISISSTSCSESIDSSEMRVNPDWESFKIKHVKTIDLPEDNYVMQWVSQVSKIHSTNSEKNNNNDLHEETEQVTDVENINTLQNSDNVNHSSKSEEKTPIKETCIKEKILKNKALKSNRASMTNDLSNLKHNCSNIDKEINSILSLSLEKCTVEENNVLLNNSVTSEEETPAKCKVSTKKSKIRTNKSSTKSLKKTTPITNSEDDCIDINEEYKLWELLNLSPYDTSDSDYEIKTNKKRKLFDENSETLNNSFQSFTQKTDKQNIRETITNNLSGVNVLEQLITGKNRKAFSQYSNISDRLLEREINAQKKRKLNKTESRTKLNIPTPILESLKSSFTSDLKDHCIDVDSYLTENSRDDAVDVSEDSDSSDDLSEFQVKTPTKRKLFKQKTERLVTPKKRKLITRPRYNADMSISSDSDSDANENSSEQIALDPGNKTTLWYDCNDSYLSPIPSSLLGSLSCTSESSNDSDEHENAKCSPSRVNLNISKPKFEKSREKNSWSDKQYNNLEDTSSTPTTAEKIFEEYLNGASQLKQTINSEMQERSAVFDKIKDHLTSMSKNRSTPNEGSEDIILNLIELNVSLILQVNQMLLDSSSNLENIINRWIMENNI